MAEFLVCRHMRNHNASVVLMDADSRDEAINQAIWPHGMDQGSFVAERHPNRMTALWVVPHPESCAVDLAAMCKRATEITKRIDQAQSRLQEVQTAMRTLRTLQASLNAPDGAIQDVLRSLEREEERIEVQLETGEGLWDDSVSHG